MTTFDTLMLCNQTEVFIMSKWGQLMLLFVYLFPFVKILVVTW